MPERQRLTTRPSGWRVYWWIWVIASTAWVGFAVAAFPETRDWSRLWDAMTASEVGLVDTSDCATSVQDVTAVQVCGHGVAQRRDRTWNRREQELAGAFQNIGIVLGPPLLVLAATFLVTVVAGDRFDRHPPPPARHSPHHYQRAAPRLRPTNYRPPNRRRNSVPE